MKHLTSLTIQLVDYEDTSGNPVVDELSISLGSDPDGSEYDLTQEDDRQALLRVLIGALGAIPLPLPKETRCPLCLHKETS